MTKIQMEEQLNKQAAEISELKTKNAEIQYVATSVSQERTRLWSLVNELVTAIRQGASEGKFPRA